MLKPNNTNTARWWTFKDFLRFHPKNLREVSDQFDKQHMFPFIATGSNHQPFRTIEISTWTLVVFHHQQQLPTNQAQKQRRPRRSWVGNWLRRDAQLATRQLQWHVPEVVEPGPWPGDHCGAFRFVGFFGGENPRWRLPKNTKKLPFLEVKCFARWQKVDIIYFGIL